jgi:hypothetical protein
VLKEYILAATLEDRFLSCRDLSARILRDFNISCSKSQVAIVRRAFGLRHLWAKKTEKLTKKHIDKRYTFAEQIQRHPFFELPWVISDESSFLLCPTRSKLYRFRGENSQCIYQEFQGYPIKCMVWGAIGPNYKSPLISHMRFKEHVTAETYIQKVDRIPNIRKIRFNIWAWPICLPTRRRQAPYRLALASLSGWQNPDITNRSVMALMFPRSLTN